MKTFLLLLFTSYCFGLSFVDLFTQTTEGFQCYRAPAVLRTPKGSLLVFVEARYGAASPAACGLNSPQKSIAYRRSTDKGLTWEKQRILAPCNCGGNNECGYPSAVVDEKDGYIWVMFSGGEGTWVSNSTNDGITWSKPVILSNLNPYAKNPSVGHGIQIQALCPGDPEGRLILPWVCGAHSVATAADSPYRSCVVYSDDRGISWHLGGYAQNGSREGELVQLSNCVNGRSVIYFNERNYAGPSPHGHRLYSLSYDSGVSFTVNGINLELIEPVTKDWTGVVGSVINIRDSDKDLVLFSDPNDINERRNLTIKASVNGIQDWNSGIVVWPGPSAYSDIVQIDLSVGIVFERGVSSDPYIDISFGIVPLKDL